MRNKGIVRGMDNLGRVVVPKEFRTSLGIGENDQVEMFLTEEGVVLKKFSLGCSICGGFSPAKVYHGKNVCKECQKMIRENNDGSSFYSSKDSI